MVGTLFLLPSKEFCVAAYGARHVSLKPPRAYTSGLDSFVPAALDGDAGT